MKEGGGGGENITDHMMQILKMQNVSEGWMSRMMYASVLIGREVYFNLPCHVLGKSDKTIF